ncbi:hypothetical protein LMG33818_001858 [Halomonadaceae bacterium LMG 33818]|uniref:hypothetical protein n=1 Tax=Cernens ardua TaxID=3402176 RepID=UPI003EDC0DAB
MERFHLVYDGQALENHTMDVRTLSPALLALGEMVDRANSILNGDQAKISLNVHASFKAGSFGIDLVTAQSIFARVHDFLSKSEVADAAVILSLLGLSAKDALKGVIAVVKWLRGRPVKKITPIKDGIVRIYVDEEHIDTEERVIQLLRDYKLRKALEGIVAPLEKEGIESVSVMPQKGDSPAFIIERDSAVYFRAPPSQDEVLDEDVYESILQIVNISFQEGNKWRFSEGVGGNAFYADVTDEKFLERVRLNQENFAKEDLIKAKIKRTQKMTLSGLRADYEIVEVLNHRSASPKVQLGLDFDND